MYVQVSKEAITGVRFLGAGVSGRGEPPDMCGRNQALGHWKGSELWELLLHLPCPPVIYKC